VISPKLYIESVSIIMARLSCDFGGKEAMMGGSDIHERMYNHTNTKVYCMIQNHLQQMTFSVENLIQEKSHRRSKHQLSLSQR